MQSLISTVVLLALIATVFSQQKVCPASTLCFVVDESGSISLSDFVTGKKVVTDIAQSFTDRTTSASTYGAVFFNSNAVVGSALTTDLGMFKSNVNKYSKRGGGTAIDKGLLKCLDLMKGKKDPRVITLITDGRSNSKLANDAAINIKNEGIYITTVGVGNGIDKTLLEKIASQPEFATVSNNYSELVTKIVNIVDDLCQVVQPPEAVGCCGDTSVEADKCYVRCKTANDCPRLQKCYTKLNPPTYKDKCCGDTIFDATVGCASSNCFTNSDCDGMKRCFGVPGGFATASPLPVKENGCCGSTAIEAEKCFVQCKTGDDCPRELKCFENPDRPMYKKKCCGDGLFNAAKGCLQSDCFFSSDCSGSDVCYGIPDELDPSGPGNEVTTGCCGGTSIEADSCFVKCKTNPDCPRAQKCYDNDSPPTFTKQCCGTSVFKAAKGCAGIECLTKADCDGDKWCFGVPF